MRDGSRLQAVRRHIIRAAPGAGSLILLLLAHAGAAEPTFATHVLPIVEGRCIECHGPDKQRAGLRLDSAAATLTGGNTGPVVVAGHPERSALIRLVSLPADHDDIMPPKGDPLTPAQIAQLTAWIQAGAPGADGAVAAPPANQIEAPTAFALRAAGLGAPEAATLERLRAAGAVVRGLDPSERTLEINLSHAKVDAALLEALKRLAPNLLWLDLGSTPIGDAELALLKPLTALEKLDLRSTAITDSGLIHLIGLRELRFLTLVGTHVSDAGLFRLYGLKHLERVYLWNSRATADGAKRLMANIPGCVANTGL